MAEGGVELDDSKSGIINKKISRRSFLVNFAKIAAGGLAAWKLNDIINDPKIVAEAGSNAIKEAHEAGFNVLKKTADKFNEDGIAKSFDLEGTLSPEEKRTLDEVIDIFYPGTSEEERVDLSKQIQVTSEYMKGLMTDVSYQNLKKNRDLIKSISETSGVPEEVFYGLVMAESRGGVDGNSVNGAGALGPVQITEPKGLDYGLNITNDENDDRLKWDRALPVAAIDITQNTRYFSGDDATYQNWGLGVWSWHKGRTGVKEEVESYSANKAEGFTDLQKYIRENNITVKSILDIPNIRERLEDPENNYDMTSFFVLRVAGGALLVKNLNRLADNIEAKSQ